MNKTFAMKAIMFFMILAAICAFIVLIPFLAAGYFIAKLIGEKSNDDNMTNEYYNIEQGNIKWGDGWW